MSDLRGLSLRQLRALAATIHTGSVTNAAKRLSVTPPAIAAQLKGLEDAVGASLYVRGPDGLEPTPVGRELIAAANEIDAVVSGCAHRIAALNAGAEGSLDLGVVSTGKYFAPRLVAAFREAHPGIHVHLSIGNRGELLEALYRREYDLAVMGRPPADLAVERDVLGEHPYVLIAPPGHRLAGRHDVTAEDLRHEAFLTREQGSGTRSLTAAFLDGVGDGWAFDVSEMGTNETIKQAVMAGLGMAIISAHTVHTELADGKLATVPLPGLPIMRHWFLIRRTDREATTATRIFRDFVVRHGGSFLPRLPAPAPPATDTQGAIKSA
ncbi:hypothetical protein CCR80_08075 [Rhodothalassium salexigens]|uniref:LysR family transcriptional regulator n=1 Tax=Rhodothalassium salexigens TaxID=1086 RepID=UPI001911EED1|nr:LysR family transcriptional regulator [Rhodothalassium salexigens]MBK5920986.1 hypothetical protein [Rhodothalassium salexigens]